MRKNLLAAMLALGLGLAATASQAAILSFQPSAQTKFLGQSASVDVVLSGLTADGQIVSGYDFNVAFDDNILDLVAVTFSGNLGAPADSLFDAVLSTGSVNLFEVSLLSDIDLDALQGDSVVLATLQFTGAAVGTSPLSINSLIMDGYKLLGTDPAVPVVLDPTLQGGSITIIDNGQPVPEPATLALTAIALAGLAAVRRRAG